MVGSTFFYGANLNLLMEHQNVAYISIYLQSVTKVLSEFN